MIAAMSDSERASELCSQLLEKIKNTLNRKQLLNMRTLDEFEFCERTHVHVLQQFTSQRTAVTRES